MCLSQPVTGDPVGAAEADLIRKDYTDSTAAYGCLGVLQAEELSYLVLVTRCGLVGRVPGADIYRITNTLLIPLHATPHQHEGVVEVAKLLTSGHFYFSIPSSSSSSSSSSVSGPQFTLLSCTQKQPHPQRQFCW